MVFANNTGIRRFPYAVFGGRNRDYAVIPIMVRPTGYFFGMRAGSFAPMRVFVARPSVGVGVGMDKLRDNFRFFRFTNYASIRKQPSVVFRSGYRYDTFAPNMRRYIHLFVVTARRRVPMRVIIVRPRFEPGGLQSVGS